MRVLAEPGRRGAALLAVVLTLGLATGAAASAALTLAGGRGAEPDATVTAAALATVALLVILVVTGGSLLAAVVIIAAHRPGAASSSAPTKTSAPTKAPALTKAPAPTTTSAAGIAQAATDRPAATADHRVAVAEQRAAEAEQRAHAAAHRLVTAEQALHAREAELAGLNAAVGSLQNPLHALAGFAELLRDEAPSSGTFLEGITRNIDRMQRVVEDLRSYTAMAEVAMRPEPVDVERLALEVAASLLDRHTGPLPGIDVGELPVVTGDAALLRQVLEHLVGNAVRFVRHGSAAQLRISAAETDGGWWRIDVADRGIGVSEEQRERIFAPFYRTPAADGYPGIGLGLAICRRIVAMHGGAIGVAANPGGGSIFHFTVSASGLTVPDRLAELTMP